MTLDLTVTDLFCGAGGSSIGAERSGARLRMAANHWALAIETHNSNFPNADHDCADVSQVDPRRYPRTDILVASPECTTYSQANSTVHEANLFDPDGDPSVERSRATMWDVPRFAECHDYECVIVENVVEVTRRFRPFPAWLHAMETLGYEHRIVCLNSMVAPPTPQSRDRLYVVFWKTKNRAPDLDIRPACWCERCGDVAGRQAFKKPGNLIGKYRQQYVYVCADCGDKVVPYAWPAASAIDWSLPCPRIGDRVRPLAEATLRRVRVGLERFGPAAIVQKSGHTFERPGYVRAWPTSLPFRTQTTETHHALVVDTAFGGDDRVRTSDDPFATQTGRQTMGVVPFFIKNYGNASEAKYRAFPMSQPLGAVTTEDSHSVVYAPFVAELRGGSSDARSIDEPLSTLTAAGNHHALVSPFYLKNYGDGTDPSMAHEITEPLGSITTRDHHALVVPYTPGRDPAKPVTEPLATVVTRDHFGLLSPARVEIEDCGFRMLEPHEVGRAMAFPDDYKVFGTKRDRVKQYGNAVTPPVMALLVERCIGSLA